MTEKRYKLSEPNGAYLIDGDKPCAHWINDDDKIIDLLNDLVDENERLKKENKQLLCTIIEILDFIEDKREVSIEEMGRWWKEKEKELEYNDC